MMIHLGNLFLLTLLTRSETLENLSKTRRVQNGNEAGETRPYMVYLKPSQQSDPELITNNWSCGGVIIHARHILTSAACIENVQHFYVVSGTYTWTPPTEETECIKYGAIRAVWKCTPADYYYDGAEFDNMRWMSGDIAVVKLEIEINFEKRVRGCDYIPQMIHFNNDTTDWEKPGLVASIAGWGTTSMFGDPSIGKIPQNSRHLLESEVQIMIKKICIKRWDDRYHHIIEESMICSKDDQDSTKMSEVCLSQGVKCVELEYSIDEYDENTLKNNARRVPEPGELEVRGPWYQQMNSTRRTHITSPGGFCENDHGGPLVAGHGTSSVVIGIMSAFMTRNTSMNCYGPYLYTSVFKYRQFIICALEQDLGKTESCRKAMQDGDTKFRLNEAYFNWRSSDQNRTSVG